MFNIVHNYQSECYHEFVDFLEEEGSNIDITELKEKVQKVIVKTEQFEIIV